MRPRISMLEASLVERIVDEAFSILASRGVLIDHEPAFDRLASLGLEGDKATMRMTIRRSQIDDALASAPSSISLSDRLGELHTKLEDNRVHFVPASSALRILDRENHEIREPTTADFVEYVKVADHLPNLAYLSTAFNPTDVPPEMARRLARLSRSGSFKSSPWFRVPSPPGVSSALREFSVSSDAISRISPSGPWRS